MSVSIVINFNGDCLEAVDFYTKVFGLEAANVMTYESVPEDPNFIISEEEKAYVMMAVLNINGLTVMMQDLLKSMQSQFNSNITISIGTDSEDNVRSWYNQMKDNGGTVTCELQAMEWSRCYGAVIDKFGTSWQFTLEENN